MSISLYISLGCDDTKSYAPHSDLSGKFRHQISASQTIEDHQTKRNKQDPLQDPLPVSLYNVNLGIVKRSPISDADLTCTPTSEVLPYVF